MRRLWAGAIVLLGFGFAPVGGLRADESLERIERARQEADAREARAREFSREAAELLAELESIDRQIVEGRRSQRRLIDRRGELERELAQAREALEAADRAQKRTRQRVDERLVAMYKALAGRGYPPLLGALEDLQAGLRSFSGLERVIESDVSLLEEYRLRREEAEAAAERVGAKMLAIDTNEADYLRRKQSVQEKLIERRNLVDILNARADRELLAARELREAAKRLEAELRKGLRRGTQGVGLRRGRVPPPVSGPVRLGFGRRKDAQYRTVTQQLGIEFEANLGEPVRAVGSGRVLFAGWLRGYGQTVIVDHGDETVSVSGYLEELAVDPNDSVLEGQVIGSVGETGSLSGPGLYFQLRKNGEPVDPEGWLR